MHSPQQPSRACWLVSAGQCSETRGTPLPRMASLAPPDHRHCVRQSKPKGKPVDLEKCLPGPTVCLRLPLPLGVIPEAAKETERFRTAKPLSAWPFFVLEPTGFLVSRIPPTGGRKSPAPKAAPPARSHDPQKPTSPLLLETRGVTSHHSHQTQCLQACRKVKAI